MSISTTAAVEQPSVPDLISKGYTTTSVCFPIGHELSLCIVSVNARSSVPCIFIHTFPERTLMHKLTSFVLQTYRCSLLNFFDLVLARILHKFST
jgi:hypothetical protein